ncbi:nucleoside-diphosphate kinase [Treponema sp. OMZ 840]|uniref:nucleoside-diphosphate kinase n=1 Tax=Treponema sp. OMZ 840 TaxID=244313 RepID=UPI003D8FC0A9
MNERCFVMLKPGAMNRRIVGEIIGRLERKGLNLTAVKLMKLSQELAQQHYSEHRKKPFFPGLISYVTSAPVLAMVWEGDNCVALMRKLVGATNPAEASPGTIRGDYCIHTGLNIIHASDSPKNAEREIALFFKPDEIIPWKDEHMNKWI